MSDYLVRGLGFNGQVRVFAARTTATVGEVQRRHDMASCISSFRSFNDSGSYDGSHAKGEEKITIKIEGNGPIGPMVIDSNAHGEVRGFVTNPMYTLI